MYLLPLLVIDGLLLNTPTVSTSVIIKTDYGLIEGVQYDFYNRFTAIPYAKPPVNELRFAPPQAMEPWNDTFVANDYDLRVSCPQTYSYTETRSEDCLLLNVYTPSDAKQSITNYVVLIWIHGGAFQHGYAGDTDSMINIIDYVGDIIIVAINYRLGILGSLYDNTYATGVQGNYAYLDQKMAIKFVYENIRYFGGDPAQIVLFGVSAGAYSIGLHLLYNNEYIAGGIMQSPPFGMPSRDPTTWFDVPSVFTSRIGCDEYVHNATALLDCWRSVSWQSIADLQSYSWSNIDLFANWNFFMSFTPTVETHELLNQPIFEWRNATISGQIPPFIIGHTRDEGFRFMSALKRYGLVDYNLLYPLFSMFFGDSHVLDAIFSHYEITSDSADLYAVMSKQFGDFAFDCAIRNISQNSMNNDVFYYQFNVIETRQYSACFNKSCHGDELSYLFGYDYDNETHSIDDVLKMYWSNFAKYLNPNEENIGNIWETFCVNMETLTMTIDEYTASSAVMKDEYNKKCEFWDYTGYAGVYCTDCDYVASDNPSSNTPDNERIEVETTDIAAIITSTQSPDIKTHSNLSELSIGIIIVGAMLIAGVILFLLVSAKKEDLGQDHDNVIEVQSVKETLVETPE